MRKITARILAILMVAILSIAFISCGKLPLSYNPGNNNGNNNGKNGNKVGTGSAIYDGILETMEFNSEFQSKISEALNGDNGDDLNKAGAVLSIISITSSHDIVVGFTSLVFLSDALKDFGLIDTDNYKIEHKQGEYILNNKKKNDANDNGNINDEVWHFSEDGYSGKLESSVKNSSGKVIKKSVYEYSYKNGVLYTQSYDAMEDWKDRDSYNLTIEQAEFTKNSLKCVSGEAVQNNAEFNVPKSIYKNHPSSFDDLKDSAASQKTINAENGKITYKNSNNEYSWNY